MSAQRRAAGSTAGKRAARPGAGGATGGSHAAGPGPGRTGGGGTGPGGGSGGGRGGGPGSGPGGSGPGSRRARVTKAPKRSFGRRLLKWFALTCLAGFLLGCAAFAFGYMSTDIPDPNKAFQAQTSFVTYADGKHQIGKFATQNRQSVPLSDVPQYTQNAVVAAENRSFWTDKGIDPKGILRAAFSNAQGNSTQGASTITQQYVKVFYLSQERTITRKIKEAFLSLKLEHQVSKTQILQGYLNTIYFGRGAYGIQAAAQAYFNTDAKDLTLRQSAVLASVLNSPGYLDPANGKDAKAALFGRYQYTLHGMASMGTISKAKADQAAQHLPKFPHIPSDNSYAGQRGYIMNLVKEELRKHGFSEAQIEGGGLHIKTTFTRKAMRAAVRGVREQRPKHLKQLHIATASVDPRTGALRGMFAGQDYLKSNGALNWALTGGSPGSAFKPFALGAGIKDGYSLKSTFQGNSPYKFPDGHTVVNEGPHGGNDYGKRISLLTATEQSVNTAYVDLTHSMVNGPQKVLDQAVKMGVPQNAPGLKAESGISLGSATINPIDMASSYGTIANGGRANDWYAVSKVTSPNGHTLYRSQQETRRALPNPIDRDVSYALQQVVKKGTGMNALALGRPAAGKTGTATNGAGDVDSSWFVGYTPQLSTAVMYVRGNGTEPLNGYMPSYFGADYPTQTWTSIMQKALEGAPVESFPPPANVKATNTDHKPMPTFTPTPTPTESPTPSPSDSPSPSPSMTPSPTPTPTPTPSQSPTGGGTFCPLGCPSNSPTGGGANDGGPGHGGGGGQGPPPHG